MALNNVSFTKGQGGLGRPLPGADYVSGLLFYRAALPSGFSTTNRVQQIFSVQNAIALGINLTYSDETQATATYLVTGAGVTNDPAVITVAAINGVVVIGTYVRASTDTTPTLVATGIAAAVNAGTLVHGYSATSATATVTIKATKGQGIFLNTGTPLVVTTTGGTIAGTVTQFSGGVASLIAPMYYQIAEYFRIQPQGNLYVGIYAIPSTYTFTEITTMQNYANGIIRQMGVYVDGASLSTVHMNTLQSVAAALDTAHMPLSILYAANLVGTALTALTDLNLLSDNKVSVVIGQDGAGLGYSLFKGYGISITCLGAVLGAVSLSKVSDDIAWIAQYNLGLGIELNVASFAEGTTYRLADPNLVSQLNGYRYIFLIKQVGKDGTWVNDSHTAILSSSDYAYIENNRTIDKAIRNLYTSYLPSLNSPIVFKSDGTLSDVTVATLENIGDVSLNQMLRSLELSDRKTTINPAQPSASTSTVAVSVKLIGIGVARNINVTIGFVLAI